MKGRGSMDRKLIKYVFLTILVIVFSGLFITASLAIDLPWEKEKKDDTRQELPPPPQIPDDTPKPSSLENPKKYFDEGVVYEKEKKYSEAILSYTKAIELNRNYAEAYCNRGYSKRMIADYTEALADYDKAIEINPKYSLAYFRRGYLKQEFLKDFQGALRDYNKVTEIDPKNSTAYNNRGIIKYQYGDYEGAIGDYEKALEINPNFELAKKNLEIAKKKLRDRPPSGTPAPPPPTTTRPPTPQGPIQGNVHYVGGDYICNYGKVRDIPPVTPGNKSMRVEQSGDRLTFIDETGKQSSGRLVDGDVLVAYDWQYGAKGHLGINVDGTFYRCKDAISRFNLLENLDWNFILWESGTICSRPRRIR